MFLFYLDLDTLFCSVVCIYFIIIRRYTITMCLNDINFHPSKVTEVREVSHCDTSNHNFFERFLELLHGRK
jgi:hypothetical protein